jgi:hypothetical protein
MRRGVRQPGQILPLFAVSLLAVTAFLGVAIDGSRLFRAHLEAQTLADEAADAGAQQVDTTRAPACGQAGRPSSSRERPARAPSRQPTPTWRPVRGMAAHAGQSQRAAAASKSRCSGMLRWHSLRRPTWARRRCRSTQRLSR